MSRTGKNSHDHGFFICQNCGFSVYPPLGGKKERNHCPFFLWSKYLDISIGDRRSSRQGLMEPLTIWIKDDGEWSIVHRCSSCGRLRINRIAPDDSEELLLKFAQKAQNYPLFGKEDRHA